MTAPRWEPVDEPTADPLSLVAVGPVSTGAAEREWERFKQALESASEPWTGTIRPNFLRGLIRLADIDPPRVGAFTHRALRLGLIAYTGEYEVSDDKHGGNAGKPCRVLRWIGGES